MICFGSVSLDGTDVDVTVIGNLPSKQIIFDFFFSSDIYDNNLWDNDYSYANWLEICGIGV